MSKRDEPLCIGFRLNDRLDGYSGAEKHRADLITLVEELSEGGLKFERWGVSHPEGMGGDSETDYAYIVFNAAPEAFDRLFGTQVEFMPYKPKYELGMLLNEPDAEGVWRNAQAPTIPVQLEYIVQRVNLNTFG